MKSSKIILALFIVQVLCMFGPRTIYCQTETLDIVQYTPLKGWTKTLKQGAVVYSDINQTANTFCVLTIYSSTASAGSPQQDFANQWNALAVKPFKAEANPKTELKTRPDGWKTTTGLSAIESDGVKSIAILAVFTGFGKTTSVLAVLNDQSYLPQLETFVEGIHLNKNGTADSNPVTNQNSQAGKFGSMMYASPAGWTEQDFSDGVVFKPSDLPAEESLAVQIMPALNFSGTLEQALAQSYDEAAAMYNATKMHAAGGGNYSKLEVQKSFNGWEYIRGKGGVQVENGTPYKTELGLELFVIRVNNRFERIAILESRKSCNLSRFYASDRRIYRGAIENFLFSLRFADWNETPLKSGSAAGAGIVGEWQGISLTVGLPTIGANLGVKLEALSPIFLSNGQVFLGSIFPIDGLDGVNTRILPELNRRDWGTYTFANGRGVLKLPYGEFPIRMEGTKLILTKNQTDWPFSKLNLVDGSIFNGTYALSPNNGVIPTITFTLDGRFTDNGAIKVLYHEYVDCINPGTTPGSGTYEVRNYTLRLNYNDGRRINIAFLGIDYDKKNPSPAKLTMSFNNDTLTRK